MTTNLILKNKDITIGNVIGSRFFIGGQKYYIVDSAVYDGQEFKPGSKFAWVDPDEDEFTEYVGIIKEIFVLNNGDVEINHDLMIGRLPLEDLILIENYTDDVNDEDDEDYICGLLYGVDNNQ